MMLLILPAEAGAADSIPDLFETSFGHEVQGNYKAALNNTMKILRKDQKNYVAYLRAGWLSYMLGENEQAVEYYKKAISFSPAAIEPALGITLPYIAMTKWDEAEKYALKVIQLDPANYYANSRLAWIKFSKGQYAEALTYYEKLHNWYPSDLEMLLGLGWTYLKMGKVQKARGYFEHVLKIRQNNIRALQGMNALTQ